MRNWYTVLVPRGLKRESTACMSHKILYAGVAQSVEQRTCNAQVVGSSPTRSSIVCWNVAIRLGEPPIKSLTQKGVQDDSNRRKKPLAFHSYVWWLEVGRCGSAVYPRERAWSVLSNEGKAVSNISHNN